MHLQTEYMKARIERHESYATRRQHFEICLGMHELLSETSCRVKIQNKLIVGYKPNSLFTYNIRP
jgi:hypothetical protein